MTENKRIFFNIIATYGRSLFALICGLFTSRWVLESLGQVDFGLFGLIGGLTMFIAFLNGILAAGVGRFYAVSIGECKTNPVEGLEKTRQWFNTALVIHIVVPIILMLIGFPLGEYAISNAWLNIPTERVEACLWVFRFTCISCFVGMVNVPFMAMYTAKQYIAELTIYSFVTTALNVCFVYYMVTHPGSWLAKYALWACLMSAVPQVIICLRALYVFQECKIKKSYLWSRARIRELISYSGWITFGTLGSLLRSQGIAILINKAFGPRVNSAMTIGNQVSGQVSTLSAAMQGAFSPAIMNAYGAGEMDKIRLLSYRACKFGTLLLLLFLLPVVLELEYILKLWLKNPPEYTAGLCLCVLSMVLIDKTSIGHMIAVNASGKVAAYQVFLGGSLILTLPLAYMFVKMGLGVYSVGIAMVMTMTVCAWGRVWFARKLVGMSAWYWFISIMLPIFLVGGGVCSIGFLPRLVMKASFARFLLTTFLCEFSFVFIVLLVVLDNNERNLIKGKMPWLKK